MEKTLEKRLYSREECFMPVNFAFEGKAYTEFIRNISNGGMYIESYMKIPAGKPITLTDTLPAKGPVKCRAMVVWDNSEGIGVQLQ